MFCYKRELLTENNFNCSLLFCIPWVLATVNPCFCRWVVVLYLVVFSSNSPPPNRPLSCPLNRRLPWKTNEENSPPVDDDFDAIWNNIALLLLLLLLPKKAVLLLHRRDEQKVPVLPIILLNRINTTTLYILSETHSFSVKQFESKEREEREKSVLVKIRVWNPKYKLRDFPEELLFFFCCALFKLLLRASELCYLELRVV